MFDLCFCLQNIVVVSALGALLKSTRIHASVNLLFIFVGQHEGVTVFDKGPIRPLKNGTCLQLGALVLSRVFLLENSISLKFGYDLALNCL